MDTSQLPGSSTRRDALEMGLYLSLVIMALIVSLERSLSDDGELLVIWGSSIGLAIAHVFAFRIAYVYEHGTEFRHGWRSVGAMLAAALGVAMLATLPYLIPLDIFAPSSAATVLLLGFVAFAAYLAARSREWPILTTIGYVLLILVLAGLVSITKYMLTH